MISLLTALALAAPSTTAGQDEAERPRPLDFAKVPRTIGKLPDFQGPRPRFGLFLFGRNGEVRVWAALDLPARGQEGEFLYIDRDADGDLDDEEPIAGRGEGTGRSREVRFVVGSFAVPGTDDVHEDFQLTSTSSRTSYRMKWRGGKISMGLYGPHSDAYGQFALKPEQAPIIVPGHDRPFGFQHWYSDQLRRGQSTPFKVYVGNQGDRSGHFSCVDDRFLPPADSPIATLIYSDSEGKQRRLRVKLSERC